MSDPILYIFLVSSVARFATDTAMLPSLIRLFAHVIIIVAHFTGLPREKVSKLAKMSLLLGIGFSVPWSLCDRLSLGGRITSLHRLCQISIWRG